MDFFEVIRARRSLRCFSDQPVAEEDLMAMLEAARLAPSATNEQLWHFIVIRDKELTGRMRDMVNAMIDISIEAASDEARRQHLSRMRFYSTHFADAPVAIAVAARPWVGGGYSSPQDTAPRDLALESAAAAVAHLQLAATALGYGSCFASAPAEFAGQELEAMLGVEPPRKPLEEICTFIG